MFTGLIEEIGALREIKRHSQAMILTISADKVLEEVKLGDSIAINGVCLTVVAFDRHSFQVDVTPETYRHSTLSGLQPGSPVNLERAMLAGGRFGGHIVQGHVDGTGIIRARTSENNAVIFTIEPRDPTLFRYIVPKGSVTLDGVSLTVVSADSGSDTFSVSIIPHTLKQTVLQHKFAGQPLNIECDILGKYVDHWLSRRDSPPAGAKQSGGLTESMLRDNGFLV